METTLTRQLEDLDTQWNSRERLWRFKLGRLRLGVEPLDDQLTRYRRVTWALTAVPSAIGLMFLTLFSVFGRPDIGLIFVCIVLVPIIAVAWIDYGLMARRAHLYLGEHEQYLERKARLESSTAETTAASGQA